MPRNPLPFLLGLEAVVLAALGFLGWRLIADRLAPPPAGTAVVITTPSPRSPAPGRQAVAPVSKPTAAQSAAPHGSPPMLSTDPSFWQQHLTQVNRDQSAWESAEWRVVQVAESFARGYLEQVVMPAVEAAASRRS